MKYLIANWKENKSTREALEWIENFPKNEKPDVCVILAPSYLHIPLLAPKCKEKNIYLASQDLSEHIEGPHTGEVSARQLQEYVNYAIIGHSERRASESMHKVNSKILNAATNNITPIICFSNEEQFDAAKSVADKIDSKLFAYEPVESIGTGNPASPDQVVSLSRELNLRKVIYGGSVTNESVLQYLNVEAVNGFLVGGASLDYSKFLEIYSLL